MVPYMSFIFCFLCASVSAVFEIRTNTVGIYNSLQLLVLLYCC